MQIFTVATSGFPKPTPTKERAQQSRPVKRGKRAYAELHAAQYAPPAGPAPLSSLHAGPPSALGSLQYEAHQKQYVVSLSTEYYLQNTQYSLSLGWIQTYFLTWSAQRTSRNSRFDFESKKLS